MKAAAPLEIELTRLTKIGGPLTKRISLAPDGTLVKDGSACVMAHGTAERVKVAGVDALGALIEGLHAVAGASRSAPCAPTCRTRWRSPPRRS